STRNSGTPQINGVTTSVEPAGASFAAAARATASPVTFQRKRRFSYATRIVVPSRWTVTFSRPRSTSRLWIGSGCSSACAAPAISGTSAARRNQVRLRDDMRLTFLFEPLPLASLTRLMGGRLPFREVSETYTVTHPFREDCRTAVEGETAN